MNAKNLTRRAFVQSTAVVGAGLLAAACQPKIVEVEKIVKETVEVEVEKEVKVVETVIVEGEAKVVEKVVTAAPASPVEGTVVVWTYPNTEDDAGIIYEPLNAAFNREYPGIKVEVDIQPWRERREKLYAAAAAGDPPDIWWADSDTLLTYAAKGVALPLEDKVDASLLTDIGERNLKMGTADGHLLIIANRIHCDGQGHNGTLMADCGFDAQEGVSTWDEILALAEVAKSKDLYADFINTFEWQHWLIWLRQTGGAVYSEDGKQVRLREEPAQAALGMWVTMFQEGFVPKEGAVGSAEAATNLPDYWSEQKQVTTHFAPANSCTNIKRQQPGFDYRVSRPRRRNDQYKLHSAQAAMRGWAISKLAPSPDAALEWLKFNIRPQILALFCTLGQQVPTGPESMKLWSADPCTIEHVRAMEPYLVFNQDNYTLWQESKIVCAPHFQAAVLGIETVDQALEAMSTELEALLAEQLQG
jgi:multiple sugar transport system substrate-binding protein